MEIIIFILYLFLVFFTLLLINVFKPLFIAILYKIKHGDKIIINFKPISGFFGIQRQSILVNNDSQKCFDILIKKNPQAKVILTNFGFAPLFLFIDSGCIKEVVLQHDNYAKNAAQIMNNVLTDGIFGVSGEAWKKQRSFLGQCFSFSEITNKIPIFKEIIHETMSQMPCGVPIVFEEYMQQISSEIMFQTFFGRNGSNIMIDGVPAYIELKNLFSDQYIVSSSSIYTFLKLITIGVNKGPQFFPSAAETKIFNRTKRFCDFSKTLIEERLAQLKDSPFNNTFLDLYLEKYLTQEGGPKGAITMDDIVHQFITFFLAGMDTTAAIVSNMCYHLSKDSNLQESLRQEINEVVPDLDSINKQLLENDKMKLLNNCLQETLRLTPATTCVFSKRALKNHMVQEFEIRKDWIVNFPIISVQRNDKYFKNGDQFLPDRWNQNQELGFNFLPFSAGPRQPPTPPPPPPQLIILEIVWVSICRKLKLKS